MRKIYWIVILLFALITQGFSQTYYAVADGFWSDPNTWASTQNGAPGSGAGNGFPEAGSNAFTDGYEIYIDQDVTITNLAVRSTNRAGNQLNFGGLFDPVIITINGALTGVSPTSTPQSPTVSVIEDTPGLIFRFTSTSALGAIRNWSYTAPINTVQINPASGTVITANATGGTLAITEELSILTGTFSPRRNLADNSGVAHITVSSGAVLDLSFTGVNVAGLNGVLGTKLNGIQINGTVNLGAGNSLSTESISMSSSGALNIAFTGANQTQGWWYQTASPSTISFDVASTVSYTASATQNIYATSHGNLSLTSSSAVTKTLFGSGLNVRGNLVVGTNVTFSPTTEVEFTGTATQTISGAGTLNFNGGIEVNKTSGTITLVKATSIAGIIVSAGTLNLGDVTTTLSSGNFANASIVTSGTSGTLTVSGTSAFSGSGTLSLNNLTVSGSATINNAAWSITGNLTNSGTLTLPSTSTVTFSGGSTQAISGNAFSIGNMTVNKTSSTLNNNGTVELLGVLSMVTGTFEADGTPAGTGGSGIFILNSDTNGDARIGPMLGGSILGEVTFERYFNNTTVNLWRNLAFPVSDVTYTELGASVPLAANSVSYYTESVLGNVDQGWTYVSSGTLTSTRGHSVRMLNVAPINVSVRGPLLQSVPALGVSPYNFGVTYTDDPTQAASQDGWNYVPNPFASPIDWNNSGWVKTRVDAAAAVWDVQNFTYRYSNVDWDGVVAQGQAFWVHTNAASPILTCTESVKEAVSDPVFYRKASAEDRLMISLKSNLYTDKAALQFRDDASVEFDGDFDAYKLQNPIFNISTLSPDGLSLAANSLPKTLCSSNVRLNMTNIEPGTYALKFDGLSSFDGLDSAVLIDHFTKASYLLTESTSHSFDVSADTRSYGPSRFELRFYFSETMTLPVIAEQNGVLSSTVKEEGEYQWFLNDVQIEGATQSSYHPTINGVYSLEVSFKGCAMRSQNLSVETTKRVFPNPVSGDLSVQVSNLIPDGVGSGEIVIISTLGVPVKQVTFGDSELVKIIDMRDVRPGQYIVSISANSKVVERVKIIVR